jgi:hypothetical protein
MHALSKFKITECVRRKVGTKTEEGWRVLKDMSILKPILISMGLMTCFQGSFINVILAASVEIFHSAGSVDEYSSTIILGVVQTVSLTKRVSTSPIFAFPVIAYT